MDMGEERWSKLKELFPRDQADSPWLGIITLPEGSLIFRGCRAFDRPDALKLLETPRFWSVSREIASEYARTGGARQRALPGFIVAATTTRALTLANVKMYPVVEAIYMKGASFGIGGLVPQEVQRLHMSDVAAAIFQTELDGVWEDGGREILLRQSCEVTNVITFDRAFDPDGAN
jgi:hypothetical protein